jgi:hypothetical protein
MKFLHISLITIIISLLILIYSIYQNKKEYPPRFKTQQQIEYKNNLENLHKNGTVNGEGWSRKAIWRYKRNYIKYHSIFIKEWDYYATYISDLKLWICMTISDLGYAGLYSISVIDLNINKYNQIEEIIPLPLGKINLPENSLDDHLINFEGKKLKITYEKKSNKRIIKARSENLILPNGKKGIDIILEMNQNEKGESINIQTTWNHNRQLFYLNEKINGLESKGKLIIEKEEIKFKGPTFTVLDWGRGVWAYKGTWYWSSATGIINNVKYGFNLGYGFSDRSPATENCIFYNEIIHKVDQIIFNIPNNIYHKWIIQSNDGKVNLFFYPKVNRMSRMNFIIIKSVQDQVFGVFEGVLKLDDGKEIFIKDLYGFAEKVYNRW